MHTDTIIYIIFVIYTSAAVLATLALFTRQSLLVAYMLLGVILGPYGLKLVPTSKFITQTGHIGIIFLLFLLGLHLHPQKLWQMFRGTALVTLFSSIIFALIAFVAMRMFGFNTTESLVIGAAMMFSSTIIALKLLPTTTLHHRHTGEVVISVLLLQDIIAIVTLIIIQAFGIGGVSWKDLALTIVALPLLFGIAYTMQRFVLIRLIKRFDKVQEYIFLLSIGWCVGMAMLSEMMGLSGEIGAFIAGVALAVHPISQYIAESLKPLRDFFLILFFFSIGAHFNYRMMPHIAYPAITLAVLMMALKPIVYRVLFRFFSETTDTAWEVGVRLGQISEFALLIAYLAENMRLIGHMASYTIQFAAMLTFIFSSYWVVVRYPTPLAFSSDMRRD